MTLRKKKQISVSWGSLRNRAKTHYGILLQGGDNCRVYEEIWYRSRRQPWPEIKACKMFKLLN